MRTRVLVVPEWYPFPETPGLGSWAREQVRAIHRRCEVAVIASAEVERVPTQSGFAVDRSEEDGVVVARVRFREGHAPKSAFANRLRGMLSALAGLRRHGFEPDVVHAHVFSAGFPALFLARRAGARLVVSEHYSGLPLGLLTPWDRFIARRTFRAADVVCPASEELARHIAPLAGHTPLIAMPNAVDTEVFFPARDRAAHTEGPRLINVGALKARKGHDDLLRAFREVKSRLGSARLEIVGEGPLHGDLATLARELDLADAVTFRGRLEQDAVAAAMRDADCFVLPSHWENAPVAVMEALASGLPVVATSVGGVPEIVEPEFGALVPPGDPSALAESIVEVVSGRRVAPPLEIAARGRSRWGHEVVADRWMGLYQAVVDGSLT